ncbi:hypothetical protein QE152_g4902 [Popillia japonica]|uniref:Uncharacterized protein n=1 Tax=Popillia japonica TaxID=7064 RepID=A0AAW1MZB1_POPJA
MHQNLINVGLVILCVQCCRCDWKTTHSITEQFKCQIPHRRSLRITELLKLNCQDDTVPAHVILNRCDDTTGTCLNQRAICTAIETRRISFYFQWRRFGETGFRNRTGRTVEHLKCGCNDTITYGCT